MLRWSCWEVGLLLLLVEGEVVVEEEEEEEEEEEGVHCIRRRVPKGWQNGSRSYMTRSITSTQL